MSDCPRCGKPMTPGQVAYLCGPKGYNEQVALPDYCTDPDCAQGRDEDAISKAIERGLIDP